MAVEDVRGDSKLTPMEEVAQLENVTKIFSDTGGSVSLFNGLSMTVRRGDFLALTGATGSGKTTLLNILIGLETPTSGSVSILGKKLSALNDDEITELRAKDMGVVLQASGLLPDLSVVDNIELPLVLRGVSRGERQGRSREAMEFFGLLKKSSSSIFTLSVGERRKVAMARAVVTEPQLLVLDEPTAGLDAPTINILTPLLRGIHYLHSRTIIMATNSLEVARIASREVPIERPAIMKIDQTAKG